MRSDEAFVSSQAVAVDTYSVDVVHGYAARYPLSGVYQTCYHDHVLTSDGRAMITLLIQQKTRNVYITFSSNGLIDAQSITHSDETVKKKLRCFQP